VLFLCIGLAAVAFTLQILLYVAPGLGLGVEAFTARSSMFSDVVSSVAPQRPAPLTIGRQTSPPIAPNRPVGDREPAVKERGSGDARHQAARREDAASFDLGRPLEATDEFSEIQTNGTGRLVYFSFVTMTTLGYGDVTPRSEAAGTLAVLQALTGQIYLAVILARIVSLLVTKPDEE
jgi:hypothetical protein